MALKRTDGVPIVGRMRIEPSTEPPRQLVVPKQRDPVCVHLGPLTGDVFPPLGGGDLIEQRLNKLGITKAAWGELKNSATLGLAGKGCGGCNWRQKAANWITSKFGMNLSPDQQKVVAELLQLEEGQRLPVLGCAVHGQCLAHSRSVARVDEAPMGCARCKREGLGYEASDATAPSPQ